MRFGLTMADLERLKPAFAKGRHRDRGQRQLASTTARPSASWPAREKADELGLKPLARIHSFAVAGCPPELMGWGPVPATQKLLKKTGVELKDIELIELNEAFAAQYLACERGLGINRDITNVNGSGVGLGHPVGCTGARIVISLLNEMKRREPGPGPGHPVRGRRHGHGHAGGERVSGSEGGKLFP